MVAGTVRGMIDKPSSVIHKPALYQLMVDGVHSLDVVPVVLPVVKVPARPSGSVTLRHPRMEATIVSGIQSNWKCAPSLSVKLTVGGDTGAPGLSVTVRVEVEGRPGRGRVTILYQLMVANSV